MLNRKRNVESDDLILALEFIVRFEEDYTEIHDLFVDRIKKMELSWELD
jgi:hypothetical protein